MRSSALPWRSLAPIASAHGAWTFPPKGLRRHTRQSPISSRYRSTTIVRSSGTAPVASAWSPRYRRRFAAARASRSCFSRSSRMASSSGRLRTFRVSAPMARPNSSVRPARSPRQKGIFPGTPGAGLTITRSCVISSTRHELAPSRNVSPTRVSKTISSSSSPIRPRAPSAPRRYTPYNPRSGNRPAARHRDPPRPLARAQRAVEAIPHQARPVLAKGRGREAPGEHVQRALEGRERQRRKGRRAPEDAIEPPDLPLLHGRHGHDLLRENVQRVPEIAGALHRSRAHLGRQRRGGQKIAAVFRNDHPLARRRPPDGPPGRSAGAHSRPRAATRPGSPGRWPPCQCPAPATRSPPAPAAVRT